MRKLSFFLFLIISHSVFAKTYNLEIKKQKIEIAGKKLEAMTINDTVPGPTLNWQEGEDVVVNVKNSSDEDTSIHWHGLLLDGSMDGVPGLNGFTGIKPGEVFTYKFKIRQSGTYWYHSHSNLQEQQGLYGSIVIEPKKERSSNNGISGSTCLGGSSRCASTTMGVYNKVDRDYVIVLSDFSEENPNTILNNLKIDSGYYNYNKRTIGTFFSDVGKYGFFDALNDYMGWGEMRMDPTDLADVTGYHFLLNGYYNDSENMIPLFRGNEFALANDGGLYFKFRKGEKVRLRFINAAAMTIFDVAIPGLKMKVVAADGQNIKPVMADEFRIGNAETYDVIVEPSADKAYLIFAQSMDRTGYAAANLAPKNGMKAKVPAMRKRTVLTMADMMMDHNMDHNDMDMHSSYLGGKSLRCEAKRSSCATKVNESGWADRGTPKGDKALEYSDLVSLYPQKDLRKPTREIEFKFGGTMSRYIWTINGEKFPKPFSVKYGERIRLKFINETMMAHPVHLHGMFMQMENGQDIKWIPNKHTVIVPPAQSVSMLLTADEAGEWAFHCHLLYHMASGMMTSVTVER